MDSLMEIKPEIIKDNFVINNNNNKYCIVYSPNKYRETEGVKDIGSQFWNYGRTNEIKDRVCHL